MPERSEHQRVTSDWETKKASVAADALSLPKLGWLVTSLALGTLLVVTLIAWSLVRHQSLTSDNRLAMQRRDALQGIQDDITSLSRFLPRLERSILARMQLLGSDGLAERTLALWTSQTAFARLQRTSRELGLLEQPVLTLAELLDQLKELVLETSTIPSDDQAVRARLDRLAQLEFHANETLQLMSRETDAEMSRLRKLIQQRERQRASLAQFIGSLALGWVLVVGLCLVLFRRQRHLLQRLSSTDRQLSMIMSDLNSTREELLDRERKRLLGEVAESVAHELGNALVPISAMTELLSEDPRVAVEHRRQCELARTACGDAVRILNQLRNHLGSPTKRIKGTRVAIDELLLQVIEFTRPKWEEESKRRGASIDVRLEVDDDLSVVAVDSELRQVFTNLILNAVDAIETRGNILIRGRRQLDQIVVDVIDDGIGVDESIAQRLGNTRYSTKVHGLGLGLHVCRDLLARCGGRLEIARAPAGGTCCTVYLPRNPEPAQSPRLPARATDTLEQFAHLKVLCVDDDASVLESLAALLTSLGAHVSTADQGAAAIASFRRDPADMVICDLGLSDEDGVQVLRQLRQLSETAKLGLLTGWDESRLDPEANWKPDFLLTKPATLAQIAEILRNVRPSTP